ncbi:hypothetical protein AX14_007846, partial [Amanita brunnescens Koide BX004]
RHSLHSPHHSLRNPRLKSPRAPSLRPKWQRQITPKALEPFFGQVPPNTIPGPDCLDPVRVEKRRKVREMWKADFPNGVEGVRAGYRSREQMRVVKVREHGR